MNGSSHKVHKINLQLTSKETSELMRCRHSNQRGHQCRTHFFIQRKPTQHTYYCERHSMQQTSRYIPAERVLSIEQNHESILLFCMAHRDIFPSEILQRILTPIMLTRRANIRFTPCQHKLRLATRPLSEGSIINPIILE